MTRFILSAGLLSVITASATVIDWQSRGVEPPPVRRTSRALLVAAPGVVEGATEPITIRPERPGVVVEKLVAIGDLVAAGGPLLRLDDRAERARVRSAEASVATAVAQRERLVNGARDHERAEARALRRAAAARLAQAEKSLRRTELLEQQNAVPEQEGDDARARVEALRGELAAAAARLALLEAPAREDELRLAEARIASARAELEAAQVELDKAVLTAPCDAQVLDLDAEIGELVDPRNTLPVAVLSDTRAVRVRAYVEELDAPQVTLGATATVSADGLPYESFSGRVVWLSPTMASKRLWSDRPHEFFDTKVREVLIEIDKPAGLIAQLRVDVLIDRQRHDD